MKRVIWLGLLALTLSTGVSQAVDDNFSPKEVFALGNQAYEKGRWDEALDKYESLVRKGIGGADLYYNLGNVYYKKGERGRAVLWYERARRLAPRDGDIGFNLSLARSHIKESSDNFLQKIAQTFSTSELSLALVLSVWIFFGLLAFGFIRQLRGDLWLRTLLWFSGSLMAVSGAWLALTLHQTYQPVGVVTAPPGEVRNGPGTEYAVGFTIPEGSKVLILSSRPQWTQVGVPEQGLKGWMPASEVEDLRRTDFLNPQV